MQVMATLLIEIPGAFLIILPWREARAWAAALNMVLMVVIALTGNYTFFNFLTATLCIPLLDSRFHFPAAPALETPQSAAVGAAAEAAAVAAAMAAEKAERAAKNSERDETLRRAAGEAATALHNPTSLLHSAQVLLKSRVSVLPPT